VASKNDKLESPNSNWVYSVLPFNIATGPVGTFVQLYILELQGTVIDIGLAITLFNAVSIPAAMVWGFVTDRIHKRRPMVILCYLAVAGTLVAFLSTRSIYGVEGLYAVFSFVSAAAATPLNLLIMETQPKSRWAVVFSQFSMVSSSGSTIGLLLGVVWADFFPLHLIVVALALLSLMSAVLSVLMIKEPKYVFERDMIVMVRRSLYERLLILPLFFLKIPQAMDFRRFFKGLRNEMTRDPQILYISIFVFYLASGIFNTSLVPSLYGANLSKSQVFLVSLVATLIQAAAFRYAGPYMERRNPRDTAVSGLVLRALSYAMFGVSVFFLTGVGYLASALVLYPLGAGIAYAAYWTASNIMIFNMLGHSNKGSFLGVYSAVVGLATMLGSFISGYTSFYLGYYVTFIAAALCLGASAALTSVLTTQTKVQPATA
jgi:MFS family permease